MGVLLDFDSKVKSRRLSYFIKSIEMIIEMKYVNWHNEWVMQPYNENMQVMLCSHSTNKNQGWKWGGEDSIAFEILVCKTRNVICR